MKEKTTIAISFTPRTTQIKKLKKKQCKIGRINTLAKKKSIKITYTSSQTWFMTTLTMRNKNSKIKGKIGCINTLGIRKEKR